MIPRRIHVTQIRLGNVPLPVPEAHHVRDVLRLTAGTAVELFDSTGNVATGVICHLDSDSVVVKVDAIEARAEAAGCRLTVASAVPKSDRADWMIEKLSELGVDRFIPLATARSVVLPSGQNKIDRWARIAVEAAKQSRRNGVMEIGALTSLSEAIAATPRGVCLSTADGATPIGQMMRGSPVDKLAIFIGPEGGWTPEELSKMADANFVAASLTPTILRVETAAVIAAGILICLAAGQ
jgi:16S rRNA (uracil1498-N3)-methyltransferase